MISNCSGERDLRAGFRTAIAVIVIVVRISENQESEECSAVFLPSENIGHGDDKSLDCPFLMQGGKGHF